MFQRHVPATGPVAMQPHGARSGRVGHASGLPPRRGQKRPRAGPGHWSCALMVARGVRRRQCIAPELHQVHQTVLAYVPAEQAEGEICRADEFERHRGLNSKLDELWS
jgi:hypothetical protein